MDTEEPGEGRSDFRRELAGEPRAGLDPVRDGFHADWRAPSRTHCDLLALWQCGDRAESISLDRLARVLGLPGKTGSGADFARLFGENRPAALAYLENDLKLTREVWLRVVREPELYLGSVCNFRARLRLFFAGQTL